MPTGTDRVVVGRFGPDEFAGLAEASWALTRLGRSIQTMTAAAAPDYSQVGTAPTAKTFPVASAEPSVTPRQSGSGPRQNQAESAPDPQSDDPPTDASTATPAGPECDRSGLERGFDLVVTAAHPHAADWLRESDWNRLLTPDGLVAVITYGDLAGGRLTDGVSTVAATLRSRGLRLWDHIALLSTPAPHRLADGHDRRAMTSPHTPARTSRAPRCGGDLPITRTHHDLVLLVPERWLAQHAERAARACVIRCGHVGTDHQGSATKGNSSDD
jgi:hypothetical protein